MNKQGRILIVDDVEQWRQELVETLRRGGFRADSASTAAEALEQLNETLYHVLILDIRMDATDPANVDGINLLRELDKRGLNEATNVIMLSAYGTKELMRTSFREYKVVDFLSKDDLNDQMFLENVQQVFTQRGNINLALEIHWQLGRPEQAVLNLEVSDTRVRRGTPLQSQMAAELEDLLCRLFYQAKSILVRPLAPGHSGTGMLWVQPFYASGVGHAVVVRIGEFSKIEAENRNFKENVQPFIRSGRNTTVLDVRRTPHLGGIIYSLQGTSSDQLEDFGGFYRSADVFQIRDALDRLFLDTYSAWYANRGQLQPLDLTADYQQLFGYPPPMLEQVIEQLKTVQGKNKLYFKSLKGGHPFTNPILTTDGRSFIRPSYVCTTHGDFNQQNLLVDRTGNMWLIDFQRAGQSHILRDVATLDSVVRFQLLAAEEATLEERLQMEEVLCSIQHFSQIEQLVNCFSTENKSLTKAYATVVHLRTLARRLVEQNPGDDMSEYYIALLYNAMNTISFSSLPLGQREHALLSASLLVDRLEIGE